MKTRLLRAIIAALLVLALTLLFDYCRYGLEHHPQFDLTRVIYLGIQGLIAGIYFLAMLRLVESFGRRT